MSRLSMAEVNAMDRARFTAAFGSIFEHAPWVADAAFDSHPFASRERLHAAMVEAVRAASPERRLALIRGHPDLAGRAALAGNVTAASRAEQASAGLDRLSPEQYERFHALNAAYKERFGFPFVMAVRGASAEAILRTFEERLENGPGEELERALSEIARIARLRIEDLVEG